MTRPDPLFLDAAELIASALVEAAVWAGDRCAWPDTSGAPYDLSTGSAGIGLFLLALDTHRPAGEVRATATGAFRHALDRATRPDVPAGFLTGRVGIAYAASRAALAWHDDELFHRAQTALAPLHDAAPNGMPAEVVTGAAGSIPPLLRLAADLHDPALRALAVSLGEHLMRNAVREGWGWSWPSLSSAVVRWPIGFAHGASGIAFALLELFEAVGDGRYRWAAEQALAYEMSFYDMEARGWPDLRVPAAAGDAAGPADPRPRIESGWANGAAGIGLARLRAWQTLSMPAYADHVAAAASLVTSRVPATAGLCSGVAGAGEFLLMAGKAFQRLDWLEAAEDALRRALRRLDSETSDDLSPGLLRGAAGVGLFALRLHDGSVPSPLLLGAREAVEPSVRARTEDWRSGYASAAMEDAAWYFGDAALSGETQPTVRGEPAPQPGYQRWQSVLEGAGSGVARSARTAVDQARIELLLAPCDLGAEAAREAGRTLPERLSLGRNSVIRLSPRARFIPSSTVPGGEPIAAQLVWRSGRDVHVEPVSLEAARGLEACCDAQARLGDVFRDGPGAEPEGAPDEYAWVRAFHARGLVDVLEKNAVDALGCELSARLRATPLHAGFVQAGTAAVHKALAATRDLLSREVATAEWSGLQVALEADQCMYILETALASCYARHLVAPQLARYWTHARAEDRASTLAQIYRVLIRIFGYPALLRITPL